MKLCDYKLVDIMKKARGSYFLINSNGVDRVFKAKDFYPPTDGTHTPKMLCEMVADHVDNFGALISKETETISVPISTQDFFAKDTEPGPLLVLQETAVQSGFYNILHAAVPVSVKAERTTRIGVGFADVEVKPRYYINYNSNFVGVNSRFFSILPPEIGRAVLKEVGIPHHEFIFTVYAVLKPFWFSVFDLIKEISQGRRLSGALSHTIALSVYPFLDDIVIFYGENCVIGRICQDENEIYIELYKRYMFLLDEVVEACKQPINIKYINDTPEVAL